MTDLQPKRSFLRKASRILPGWGFFDYYHSGDMDRDRQFPAVFKSLLHFANTYAGILATIAYTANIPSCGLNSLKREKTQVEERECLGIHTNLLNHLFMEQLFFKKAELLDRAGNTQYSAGSVSTRQPKTNDLQRAIDFYKQ